MRCSFGNRLVRSAFPVGNNTATHCLAVLMLPRSRQRHCPFIRPLWHHSSQRRCAWHWVRILLLPKGVRRRDVIVWPPTPTSLGIEYRRPRLRSERPRSHCIGIEGRTRRTSVESVVCSIRHRRPRHRLSRGSRSLGNAWWRVSGRRTHGRPTEGHWRQPALWRRTRIRKGTHLGWVDVSRWRKWRVAINMLAHRRCPLHHVGGLSCHCLRPTRRRRRHTCGGHRMRASGTGRGTTKDVSECGVSIHGGRLSIVAAEVPALL